ncbi:hypothetical protein ES703_72983 [subsurface metagenome]
MSWCKYSSARLINLRRTCWGSVFHAARSAALGKGCHSVRGIRILASSSLEYSLLREIFLPFEIEPGVMTQAAMKKATATRRRRV